MTKEKLVELMPEFNWIKDEELREKTIRVWLKACAESDWSNLTEIPFSGGFSPDPDNLVFHIRMVTDFSYEVAKISNEYREEKADVDIVVAGALLHDVCKLAEYSAKGGKSDWGNKVTHGIYGIHLAQSEGLPLGIIHIIASHTEKLGLPSKTLEAIIVRYCDNVVAASSYLLARNMVKSNEKWVKL